MIARLSASIRRLAGLAAINLGQTARLVPLSDDYGFDRGKPIDRHYIEAFLEAHSADIRGHVLEVADDFYTRRFGDERVSRRDIIDLSSTNPNATIVGDLTQDGVLLEEEFDCIILTQTLHLVFDLPRAIARLRGALRPGGVLLITVPGITPVDRRGWSKSWYWSMTGAALEKLLGGAFQPDRVAVQVYGNLYAATAFLHGAALQETRKGKLDVVDPAYPVIVAARAVA